jgi:hypothetical protein
MYNYNFFKAGRRTIAYLGMVTLSSPLSKLNASKVGSTRGQFDTYMHPFTCHNLVEICFILCVYLAR